MRRGEKPAVGHTYAYKLRGTVTPVRYVGDGKGVNLATGNTVQVGDRAPRFLIA